MVIKADKRRMTRKKCKAHGCDRWSESEVHGLCVTHNWRWLNHGSLYLPKRAEPNTTPNIRGISRPTELAEILGVSRQRAHQLLHSEEQAARRKLNDAVKRGLAKRPSFCERCGKHCIPEGHHYDYAKPLTVFWLCPPCHSIVHPHYAFSKNGKAKVPA